MEEEGIILQRATFEFSQDANCLTSSDEYESLTIECESSLGIDRDEGCFYVFKDGTHFFNAAVLDEQYNYTQKPMTFNWDKETNTIEFL